MNSLIAASIKFSFRLNIGCPKGYQPDKKILNYMRSNKNKIFFFYDAKKAASQADVIFSDKVISMNDKVNKLRKLNHFKKFRINKKLMKLYQKGLHFSSLSTKGDRSR